MKSKLLLSLFIFCFSFSSAYAYDLPFIDFPNRTLGIIAPGINSIPAEYGFFQRMIGNTEANLLSLPTLGKVKIESRTSGINNYNLLTLNLSETGIRNDGVYVFDNQNNIIGYCLLEPLDIYFYQDASVILNIKSLTPNSNYLQVEIIIPANMTLKFYERDAGNFIERYAIVISKNRAILLQDSFYPKNLEENMKPYIVRAINYNLNYYDKLDN
jgi:hypothetical protein